MGHGITLLFFLLTLPVAVTAQQGVVGDVLAGKLVKPKVGQWAWYDLNDTASGRRFVLRQAIVGEEKVDRKTGYWVELEIIPRVGYKSVYKMLLTGPASDPRHVRRVIMRQGLSPPQVVEVPNEPEEAPELPKTQRESLGMEDIETAAGVIRAEHLKLTTADKTSDVWINEKVRPMGIVRMVSPEGELLLRNYGQGGDDARSVIDDDSIMGEGRPLPETKIEVRVNGEEQGGPTDAEEQGAAN